MGKCPALPAGKLFGVACRKQRTLNRGNQFPYVRGNPPVVAMSNQPPEPDRLPLALKFHLMSEALGFHPSRLFFRLPHSPETYLLECAGKPGQYFIHMRFQRIALRFFPILHHMPVFRFAKAEPQSAGGDFLLRPFLPLRIPAGTLPVFIRDEPA